MQIIGLPEHLKNYSLAYFEYFATGEGITIQAEILNDGKQRTTIGFSKMEPEIIPCVISIEQHGQTYLEWNPEFKMRFLECFGATMWAAFQNCCGLAKNVLDLKLNMHYNLS